MSFLLGLLTYIPNLISGFFGWLKNKDTVAGVQSTNAEGATVAIVQSEVSRQAMVKDISMAMMSHPVFWVAWGLGVFPVLLYHASIFFVSTFPFWGWTIHKVPVAEAAFGNTIVGNVFLLTGTSAVISALASAWIKRA